LHGKKYKIGRKGHKSVYPKVGEHITPNVLLRNMYIRHNIPKHLIVFPMKDSEKHTYTGCSRTNSTSEADFAD